MSEEEAASYHIPSALNVRSLVVNVVLQPLISVIVSLDYIRLLLIAI